MFDWIGEVTYRRRRLILTLSAVFVIACGILSTGTFATLKVGGFLDPRAQSATAADLLGSHFGGQVNLVFLVTAKHGTVDSPDVVAAGRRLTAELAHEPTLTNVASYWSTHAPALKAPDGSSAVITTHVGGGDNTAQRNTNDLYAKYQATGGPIGVSIGGQFGINHDISSNVTRSLVLAESIAVPLTLILLVLAFGSVVAASLPLVIGLLAIVGTFGELAILGRLTDVSIFATNLTTALGLALGVDYALFMVARFRERLTAGSTVPDAVRVTVRTAGRTILFSAITVAAALATMAVFPLYFLRSFAYAGVGVVVIAALASLFVVPAILAVLGHRVNALALPWSAAAHRSDSPLWGRLAGHVTRRPVIIAVPIIAGLLVLATPLLGITFGTPDSRVLPAGAPSRVVTNTLDDRYTSVNPAAVQIVARGQVIGPAVAEYARSISGSPAVAWVASSAGTFARGHLVASLPTDAARATSDAQWLTVSTTLPSKSAGAVDFVKGLRAAPGPDSVPVVIGGTDAELIDTEHAISSHAGQALAIIVAITFVVLFLFTGSVTQPLRALVLNALSVSASFGVVVWIFQEGHLSNLLGFTAQPTDTAMTVLAFCIVFGLSMDYEVFLISRIKELHDQGVSNAEAVSQGLTRTGRIVSTAAGMLAVSFFAFVPSSISFLQLFGVAAGLAILIDAIIIRGVLVPAAMTLMGNVAWWSPPPLRWLHTRTALAD